MLRNEFRFHFCRAAWVGLLTAFLSNFACAQSPKFTVYEMGKWGSGLGHTSLVDIDKDGDLDFTVGTQNRKAAWWEYRSPNDWVLHEIGDGHGSDVGGVAHDVDGDGDVDLVGKPWRGEGRHFYLRNMHVENGGKPLKSKKSG